MSGVTRRLLLVGGGAGLGLIVAWGLWPRQFPTPAPVRDDEHGFGAWIRIAEDGRLTVAIPVAEHGQGVFTVLAQVVADELGADWRTVGVEPAAIGVASANPLAATELFGGIDARVPVIPAVRAARGARLMLTGGATSLRQFELPLREAAAAARTMLVETAVARWGVSTARCATRDGFVVEGTRQLRFGELAADAAARTPPKRPVLRSDEDNRLSGTSVTRLDTPAKLDGSANFAGDVRLPGMLYAAIRQGPLGDTRLIAADRAAADAVPGAVKVVTTERWIAVLATDSFAARRALDAARPRFETRDPVSDESLAAALDAALMAPGARVAAVGDLDAALSGRRLFRAHYAAAPGVHASLELPAATAQFEDGRLRLWIGTLAPAAVRAAAARVLGIGEDAVSVIPMQLGGSFGAGLDTLVAEQAAWLAKQAGRPVQLSWSRGEDIIRDRFRAPARAAMTARMERDGRVTAWHAKVAAPATGRELATRLMAGDGVADLSLALPARGGDAAAVGGAEPPYGIANWAVDHHVAAIGTPTGHLHGGAHGYTAFFAESFIDELARRAEFDASYFRIRMLGQQPRLANCLNTVASIGGWQGGIAGSGQGIAAHAFRGSYIAVLAEAGIEGGRVRCSRLVAAVDCGRIVHPDIVLQRLEGGLVFGLAQALGCATRYKAGVAAARTLADLRLPMIDDLPDITVELIRSEAEPGGVSDLSVPPVAPAIANAVAAASGLRLRRLPLDPANP
ncbi:aldehyde oxidase [Sphingomonas spermidinifaciens]|uniref:Aldehyde oxidase n=1 Tax=Sphingomonas spermidinifaciens TaxID=1141889 RepID=A0A2A4B5C6_9SPHN|nr:molybdopterin cofactor-binding domain-containing protein [Sphingomonas spermidinifaciens]PCD03267.1 aldehyde oxidase [Sphingomonas spermidinifaciens]